MGSWCHAFGRSEFAPHKWVSSHPKLVTVSLTRLCVTLTHAWTAPSVRACKWIFLRIPFLGDTNCPLGARFENCEKRFHGPAYLLITIDFSYRHGLGVSWMFFRRRVAPYWVGYLCVLHPSDDWPRMIPAGIFLSSIKAAFPAVTETEACI